MSVATSTAIAIAAGVGAAGSIGSAAIGSHAAGKAASTQAQAAEQARQLQAEQAKQALGINQQQFGQTQQNYAPYLASGQQALGALNYGLGLGGTPMSAMMSPGGAPGPGNPAGPVPITGDTVGNPTVGSTLSPGGPLAGQPQSVGGMMRGDIRPGQAPMGTAGAAAPGGNPLVPSGPGALIQPWSQQFVAPTAATEQNDPGYQFRLQQGEQALQRSAAAQGNLLTGNTARDVNAYGQDYASSEYGNVYQRALGQYQQNYNIFNQNQAKAYDRLSAQAGMGQQAVGQLGAFGQGYAANAGNILMGGGAQQAQDIQNAAAARASGYVGSANQWGGALGGLGSNIMGALTLGQLMRGQGGGYNSANNLSWNPNNAVGTGYGLPAPQNPLFPGYGDLPS